jgi:hypothetical protein
MSYEVTDVVGQGHTNSPSDGVAQGTWEQSEKQKGRIGARRQLSDGRVFYYSQCLGAVPAGKLAAIDASTAVEAELAATGIVNSSGGAKDYASSDSVTRIYLKDSDILTGANSTNVFAGGYFVDNTNGPTYKIRDNAYTAATSVMDVLLYDSLRSNINSEDEVSLTGHVYNNLVVAANGTDDALAGVATVAITAGYFGWVQTWGACGVLCDGATAMASGTIVVLSDDDDGAVQTLGGKSFVSEEDIGLALATEPFVGYAMAVGTDGNFVCVFLQLAA